MAYSPYQQRRIDAGICLRCPDPVVDGKRYCPRCAKLASQAAAERTRALRAEWRQRPDLCSSCGAAKPPEDGYSGCQRCRDKASRARKRDAGRYQGRKAAIGECSSCTEARIGESRYCRKHLLRAHLRRSHVPFDQHDEVWAILERQEFRCYYSGEPLVPGRNLSLDHKIPVSVDPSRADDVSNFVWCSDAVNRFKNAYTDEQFIDLCRKVARHFD